MAGLLLVLAAPAAPVETADPADVADAAAARGGDGEAFERLVRRWQGRTARWLWRFTRDRGTLEELVQDTFVQAYSSLPGWRGEAPFGRWLRKIAVRAGYRYWKELARERSRRADLEEGLPAGPVRMDDLSPSEAAELLYRILARLGPRDRLVLTLLHLEGLSVEEASAATGWTKAMVKVQAFRARRRLGKAAGELGLVEEGA